MQDSWNIIHQQQGPTLIYCDNISAIKLSKKTVLNGESNILMWDTISYVICTSLIWCFLRNEDQIADILTKPLKTIIFMKVWNMLGIFSLKDVAQN